MSARVWLLVFAVCAFVELATFLATNGVITFWFAAIGLVALLHALRLMGAAAG